MLGRTKSASLSEIVHFRRLRANIRRCFRKAIRPGVSGADAFPGWAGHARLPLLASRFKF